MKRVNVSELPAKAQVKLRSKLLRVPMETLYSYMWNDDDRKNGDAIIDQIESRLAWKMPVKGRKLFSMHCTHCFMPGHLAKDCTVPDETVAKWLGGKK